jgi:uncharacterized protein YecT (DUF1311 family)
MKKYLVPVLLSLIASSAFALDAKLEKRFPILKETTPSVAYLKFIPTDKATLAENIEIAKELIDDMKWVKTSKWNKATTDMCFNTASSTMETNYCASQQLRYVQGTTTGLFDVLKDTIRSNEYLKSYNFEIVAAKYVRNAAIAQGKIAASLCDADSMGWYGGSGRMAIILGCQSDFVSDTSDFEGLGALASYDGSALNMPEDSQELYEASEVAYVIEKQRRLVKKHVDEGEITFDQEDLTDVDAQLTAAYKATKAYYTKNYSEGDYGWILPEGQTLAKYALEALTKTEKAWIGYRDAYCQAYSVLLFPKAEEHEVYGPLARVQCLSSLTRKQIDVLNKLDRENSPE